MPNLSTRISRARVLIVDDAALSQYIITKALANAGFQKLEVAADGTEALEKTYNSRPDLVILDLGMPNLDGFGYCQKVRDDTAMPRIPILVQTEIEERETKLRALSCGADDFLNKPLDTVELSLRAHILLTRYFMFQDMGNLCTHLRAELAQASQILPYTIPPAIPPSVSDALGRHYHTLEEMVTTLSTH